MSVAPHDMAHDAAAYVLGGMDRDARLAFEAHLATCPECTAEVRSLLPVTDALAQAVPQRTPSPALRERVLAGFQPAAVPDPVRTRPASAWTWLPIAASLILTAGVGVYATRLQTRIADLEARLAQADQQASAAESVMADARRTALDAQSAMAVLAAPDVARIDLAGQPPAPQARARALWSRDRGMVFTVSNLPALPQGRVYQVWVVTAGMPISAGLLTPDGTGGGSVYFATPPDIPAPVALAVTLEPAGGVPAPTGERYLIGTPTPL